MINTIVLLTIWQEYIDAREEVQVLARFINDCRNPAATASGPTTRNKGMTSNATSDWITEVYNVGFEKRPGEGRAMVVALRPISAGEAGFFNGSFRKRWHPDLEPYFRHGFD